MKKIGNRLVFSLAVISATLNSANADQLIMDDLIVQSSNCVGVDCTNGENFGYNTLVLKENNLNIYFNDTSNSGSFPRNDWILKANDSTNGGENYFAIVNASASKVPFKVMSGAPKNALYISDYGKLGLGTDNPRTEIEMSDGDTPTIRFNQNGTAGWAPQIWDVAGNEINFFIRDATNGNNLPFRIRTGASDKSLVIDTSKVSVGSDLEVSGNIIATGSVFNASDKNLKENFKKIDSIDILNKINKLDITSWNYKKDDDSIKHIGPMSQDFYSLFKVGINDKTIAPLDAASIAITGIKALSNQVEKKDIKIKELEAKVEELEAKIKNLEAIQAKISKIEDFIKKSSVFKVTPNQERSSKYQDSE